MRLRSLLGGPFDLVSRVSKVGYGGFSYGFWGILSRLTKSKGPPSRVFGLSVCGPQMLQLLSDIENSRPLAWKGRFLGVLAESYFRVGLQGFGAL